MVIYPYILRFACNASWFWMGAIIQTWQCSRDHLWYHLVGGVVHILDRHHIRMAISWSHPWPFLTFVIEKKMSHPIFHSASFLKTFHPLHFFLLLKKTHSLVMHPVIHPVICLIIHLDIRPVIYPVITPGNSYSYHLVILMVICLRCFPVWLSSVNLFGLFSI